jgi:hypothetical protein
MPATPSITYWNRLEPDPRSKSLQRSLAAEIRDPLWLLTRQWQLGEFQGENAGTPMSVEYQVELFGLTTFGPAASPTAIEDGPLDPQLHREAYLPDLATRVELAQMWMRLLPSFDLDDYDDFRSQYPLPDPEPDELRDPASVRFLDVAKERMFDGYELYKHAVSNPSAIPGAATPPVKDVITPFKDAVTDIFETLAFSDTRVDPPTWRPEQLDQEFEVRAKDAAREYSMAVHPGAEGDMDWDAFDLKSSASATGGTVTVETTTIAPTRLRFSGMPSPRFWDFESGTTNLPDVNPDRRDVAKLLMLDLMLVHGVDWFVAHVPVPVGKLVRVKSVKVRNVFGEETVIPRGEDLVGPRTRRWTVFSVAGSSAEQAGEFFILPASAATAHQTGQLLEEISFGRDETANMAWAIERFTETQLGESWPGPERAAAFDALNPTPPVDPSTDPLRYQLGTKVPLHWIPFLPVKIGTTSQIKLVEAEVAGQDRPDLRSRILRPPSNASGPYTLMEEEVPREGVSVRRQMVRTRWHDGKAYLWVERHRSPGSGETQSGLRFDQALDTK